jgi:cytochrome c556
MLSTNYGRTAAIVLTGFIVGAAIAHEEAHGIIAVRMKAMKTMQQELKAIGEMLVGKQPFDPASVRRHAENSARELPQDWEHVPAGKHRSS